MHRIGLQNAPPASACNRAKPAPRSGLSRFLGDPRIRGRCIPWTAGAGRATFGEPPARRSMRTARCLALASLVAAPAVAPAAAQPPVAQPPAAQPPAAQPPADSAALADAALAWERG